MPRQLERVDRRVAAHEADHRAFHRARQSATCDDFQIQAGRGETGAACDQDMRQPFARRSKVQLFDGRRRKGRRLTLKEPHTRGGGRKISAPVEVIGRCRSAIRMCRGIQIGIAVLDPGSFRHAAEERRIAFVPIQKRMTELQEGLMHIVGRHGGRDPIDMRVSQSDLFSWRMKPRCNFITGMLPDGTARAPSALAASCFSTRRHRSP